MSPFFVYFPTFFAPPPLFVFGFCHVLILFPKFALSRIAPPVRTRNHVSPLPCFNLATRANNLFLLLTFFLVTPLCTRDATRAPLIPFSLIPQFPPPGHTPPWFPPPDHTNPTNPAPLNPRPPPQTPFPTHPLFFLFAPHLSNPP